MTAWITGTGAVSPLGQGSAAFLDGLLTDAASGARRVGRLRGLDPIESRRLDRIARLAVLAAQEAVARSALPLSRVRARTGVVLGTLSGGVVSARKFLERALVPTGPPASPAVYTNAVRNAVTAHVTLDLELHGPSCTVSLGAASALAAVNLAVELIGEGRADALVAGGVEEIDDELAVLHRTHGRRWDTEGAYLLLLEQAAAARARGAVPLAEICGCAQVSPPVAPGAATDDPTALDRAVATALRNAGCAASEVGLIIGTTAALPELPRGPLDRATPVLDLASRLGESSCVGAAGVLLAVHALQGGELPGAATRPAVDAPDPVLVLGAGAGGPNGALLLSRRCLFA